MEQIQVAQQNWEKEQKAKLVMLGQGHKPYPDILAYLETEIENSKRVTNFDYTIPCFKNDGVYQLHKAIEEIIGTASVQDAKGPSGGDMPVNTIEVILSNGVRKKVPYGTINLPGMGEDAQIDIQYHNKNKVLLVRGTCQFKFQHLVDEIIDKTKFLLNTDSIYKNQAFEVDANIDNGQPQLLDLRHLAEEEIILAEKTEYELSSLYARIRKPLQCKEKGIALKFGVLLEGPYGTGKTLFAFKLAQEAIQNGWSFVYLKSPELLAETLRMSKTLDKNGHGIIVFVEDIDQVTRGERNAALQDILNTLDGGDTKGMNVISLFTTNHIELIEPTFLRGKRIGSIVSMPLLDRVTAKKYVEKFCADVELEGNFEPVYELIENSNIAPAFMAEIVETVKSNMVIRDENSIKAEHLEACVESYLRQVGLAQLKDTSKTQEMVLAESLRGVVFNQDTKEALAEISYDMSKQAVKDLREGI